MSTADDDSGSIRIAFTLIEAARGLLTKKIWLDDSGAIVKQAAASPSRGTFSHYELEGLADEIMTAFAATLRGLNSRQAIIAALLPSPLAPDGNKWRLRLADEPESETTLPRAQKTFKATKGPALGFFDFDVPTALQPDIRSPVELYEKILLPAWPGFADVALVTRPSVSSGARLASALN